jgi:hypothetical protein
MELAVLFVLAIVLTMFLIALAGKGIDRKYARNRPSPADEVPLKGRAANIHYAIVGTLPGAPNDECDLLIRAISKVAAEHFKAVDVPPPPPPMRPS